ncbi:MAG: ArnT family glycosyltransferase [Gemmatimonadales bacterium]
MTHRSSPARPARLEAKNLLACSLLLVALASPIALLGVRTGDTTGAILVAGHAVDLAAALAMLVLCAAVGNPFLGSITRDQERPLEGLIFGLAIGIGITATAILGAAAALGVHRWVLALTIVTLAAACRRHVPIVVARVVKVPGSFRQLAGRGRSRHAMVWLLLVTAFLISMALVPPSDWDSLMYHLQVPKQWLLEGRIFVPDGNDQAALIGVAQMVYLPFLAMGSSATPAVLSAALAVILALSAFAICARFWPPPTRNYILVTLWGSPAIILVAITARVDITVTLFTLLAHYALLLAWTDRTGGPWLDIGAVFIGLAFGVKYHGGLYAVALLPLVVLICRRNANLGSNIWAALARFGALAAVSASPWLLKNGLLFHAPFYPFLSPQTPADGWLASFPASATATGMIDPRIYQIGRLARAPFNLVDAFFSPVKVTIEGEGRLYWLSPVLLLLPLWFLRWRDRVLLALAGPALIYLVALISISPETNLRYLIPGIVPLTIVSTGVAVQFSTTAPRLLQWLTRGFLVIGCVLPALIAMSVMMLVAHPLGHLIGVTSARAYLRTYGSFDVRQHERLVEFSEGGLPSDSRTLMLFEARGFYFPTSVIEDIHLTNWPLLASRLPQQGCPHASSITHIVAGEGYAKRYLKRGVPPEVIKWESFTRFAAQCLTLMYADTALSLYRFRGPVQEAQAR